MLLSAPPPERMAIASQGGVTWRPQAKLRDGSISGFGCMATHCVSVRLCVTPKITRRTAPRRTCVSAGESARLSVRAAANEGQGQGHGRVADGKRAAVVVVGAAVAVRPPLTACAIGVVLVVVVKSRMTQGEGA